MKDAEGRAKSTVLPQRPSKRAAQEKRKPAKSARAESRRGRMPFNIRSVPKQQSREQISDLEDILLNVLITSNSKGSGTLIENLFYNLTPSISNLGYMYGFAVGKRVFLKSQTEKNILPDILEKMGFGRVTYQPFSDELIITSTGSVHSPLPIKSNIHVYEAGIISGYLSADTGVKLNTVETHCMYNDSHFCQFVCSPLVPSGKRPLVNGEALVDALAQTLKSRPRHNGDNDYFILHMLPLLKEPLLNELARIMDLAGIRLAERSEKSRFAEIMQNMAANFGISKITVNPQRGKRRTIKLRYGQYNSTDSFLKLSIQPFVGFSTQLLGSDATLYKNINKDNTYTVTIELKKR